MYFLFEINNVKKSTNKNKLEIIKGTIAEKYQPILKTLVIKMYENITDNINEEIIMGKNNINDSKIINFIMLAFSKPKILKTKFWYTLSFPITLTALDITISPIKITKPEINILAINNLLKKSFVLFIYSVKLIYVIVGNFFNRLLRFTKSSFLNFIVDINSWGIFDAYLGLNIIAKLMFRSL